MCQNDVGSCVYPCWVVRVTVTKRIATAVNRELPRRPCPASYVMAHGRVSVAKLNKPVYFMPELRLDNLHKWVCISGLFSAFAVTQNRHGSHTSWSSSAPCSASSDLHLRRFLLTSHFYYKQCCVLHLIFRGRTPIDDGAQTLCSQVVEPILTRLP